VTVRVRAEEVEVYVGTTLACTMPRLAGRRQHAINYRHVIWSLVRKPGAFAAWRCHINRVQKVVDHQTYRSGGVLPAVTAGR